MIYFKSKRISDFHRRLAESIPCVPNDAATRKILFAKTLPELLIDYLHYAGRSIPARKRQILEAPNFWTSATARQHGGAILTLQAKIACGEDLGTYLSKDARRCGFMPNRPSRSWEPEKDLVLNGFGYHHLHIQEQGRGNELVFVSFDRTSALMLMAGDHRTFMDGSLALAHCQIQVLSGNHIRGVLPPDEPFDAKRQMVMARNAVGSAGHSNGRVTFGPLFVSSGHAVRHTRFADYIMRVLTEWDSKLDDDKVIASMCNRAGIIPQDQYEFEWRMQATDLLLFERLTGSSSIVCKGFY